MKMEMNSTNPIHPNHSIHRININNNDAAFIYELDELMIGKVN